MTGKSILHYRILEKLGEGGMGVVYLALDTKLDRKVAIKFLPHHIAGNSDERKRFEIEAKAAAALNHPNIGTIHAIEIVDENIFIVMEYIEGVELKEKLTSGPLSTDESQHIALQIARGLEEAHEKNIIHRDIKSSNIMITDKGQVKIMDFGLAKVGKGIQLTKEQSTLGTAAYMSPEQARGEEVDHRSDIWSFGVVLYEMLTNTLPFRGDYEQAVIYAILNESPEAVSTFRNDIPKYYDRFIQKILAKNPGERYQSMSEVIKDIEQTEKVDSKISKTSLLMHNKRFFLFSIMTIFILLTVGWYYFGENGTPTNNNSKTEIKRIAVLPFTNIKKIRRVIFLALHWLIR
jgi:non-specific serine/threonine protein kinase